MWSVFTGNNQNIQHGLRVQYDALWKYCLFVGILMQLIANCGCGAGALRSINLIVEPSVVRRGQSVTFYCRYNLNPKQLLYSVKFYRGEREFYRYTPNDLDSRQKVFPFPGIVVDKYLSDDDQVVIKNVGFGLSGNFSCEATADAPTFSTAMAHTHLQVVELPFTRPSLKADFHHYVPGDILKANCSSTAARPKVELVLTINNMVIYNVERENLQTFDGLTVSSASIQVHLHSLHFGNLGQLVLRCTAQVGDFYQEYSELELGIPQRDPIPARVTSSSSSNTSVDGYSIIKLTTTFSLFYLLISYFR